MKLLAANLFWDELTQYEKELAKEQYVYIRECEEERKRDEVTDEYPDPIDWEGVKGCTFDRYESEDDNDTTYIEVWV